MTTDKSSSASEALLPIHGGYRRLKSFQIAQLIYDLTVRFCERYVPTKSRTRDQMVQAARSGVQNIAEGSVASGTSKKMELKLTNVARASLEELKLDYEDYLRQHGLLLWPMEDSRRQALVKRRCKTVEEVVRWIYEEHNGPNGLNGQDGHGSATSIESIKSIRSIQSMSHRPTYQEIAANAAHTLIGVASALLSRQLTAQAKAFENEGGFTERLHRIRTQRRR